MEELTQEEKFIKSSVQKLPKKRKFDPSVLEHSDKDALDKSKQKFNTIPESTNHFIPQTVTQFPSEPKTVLIPPQSMAVDYSCISQMPGKPHNNIVVSYSQLDEKIPNYMKIEEKHPGSYIKLEEKHGDTYMKDNPMLVKREVYSDIVQNPSIHHQQNYLYPNISPSQNSHESNNQEVSIWKFHSCSKDLIIK